MGSIFQGIINGAPNLVFDSMKPFMLKEAYSKIRTEIDTKVKDLMADQKLPNSISPLDMAIGEARRRVREMGFDPFLVKNYNHTVGIFTCQLKNTWIQGVSGFYRVGNLILGLDNNTVTIGNLFLLNQNRNYVENQKKKQFFVTFSFCFEEMNLGTQEIMGSTDWEVTAGKGMITRTGHVQFFVQYIQATVVISQKLDTRNQPQIKDLQLELGNIQVRYLIDGYMHRTM